MEIPRIPSLHTNKHSERIRLGIDFISFGRVLQLLQDIPRTDTPAIVLDGDVRRWVIVGLQEVSTVQVGREIRGN